jgi:hypothetical protein
MTSDHVSALLSAVETAHGHKVYVVAMLLALTMHRLRSAAPALQKVAWRK